MDVHGSDGDRLSTTTRMELRDQEDFVQSVRVFGAVSCAESDDDVGSGYGVQR